MGLRNYARRIGGADEFQDNRENIMVTQLTSLQSGDGQYIESSLDGR